MKLVMYTSIATTRTSVSVATGLCPIVKVCRKNNPVYGITGMGVTYKLSKANLRKLIT